MSSSPKAQSYIHLSEFVALVVTVTIAEMEAIWCWVKDRLYLLTEHCWNLCAPYDVAICCICM